MSETLVIDDLVFELRRSPRRKTVEITVDREGELILSAPSDSPVEQLEQVARDKRFWIYTKLALKELLFQPPQPKEFISGESFYYLGRSYRLLLVDAFSGPALVLLHGRFRLRRDEQFNAQQHFIDWYTRHGQPWIERRVRLLEDRIGVEPGRVQVRDLGFRWGSCGQGGSLNFHWRVVALPPRIIEYVIAHEMVHLIEPHHTDVFWRRLERVIPDLAGRKLWLAHNGSRF